jgi:2-oxoisovalerate dehydrogenase E1 component alpha subunit
MISTLSTSFLRDIYSRMLLTRIVDDYAWQLHEQERINFVASCRGHEAAQVGSALCIEVGKDFTLPYYRDLGVVLTIGMTPYEVFRTYLTNHYPKSQVDEKQEKRSKLPQAMLHWGYHKHNTVTGPAPIATQILHAAGIAFASKLRKAPVVTVAYCSDSTITEADFLEAIQFAALHQLPVIFVCEQDCTYAQTDISSIPSCTSSIVLPAGLTHRRIDGSDVVTVYTAMHSAMQYTREGHGPILLEMSVTRLTPPLHSQYTCITGIDSLEEGDPLTRCRRLLQEQGAWNNVWATQLCQRLLTEVECAMQEAIHHIPDH